METEVQPVEEQQPPAEEAVVETPAVEEPAIVDDEPLEPEIAAQVIDIPDGEKLVPLSALTKTRQAAKEAKRQVKELTDKAAEADTLRQQVQQMQPMAEVAKTLLQQVQNPPQVQQVPQAPPEDTRELEEIARDFELYKPDGTTDIDRARKIQQRTMRTAQAVAQAQTQPLVAHTLTQTANHMLSRALNTTLPGSQDKADADIVRGYFERVASQPGGLALLANEANVKVLWNQAYADTLIRRGQNGTPAAPAAPKPVQKAGEPLFVEKSGGGQQPKFTLNAMEKQVAKDLGLTEAEYAKRAATMPWRE